MNVLSTLLVLPRRKFDKLYSDEVRRLLTLVYSPLANQDGEHDALFKKKKSVKQQSCER